MWPTCQDVDQDEKAPFDPVPDFNDDENNACDEDEKEDDEENENEE